MNRAAKILSALLLSVALLIGGSQAASGNETIPGTDTVGPNVSNSTTYSRENANAKTCRVPRLLRQRYSRCRPVTSEISAVKLANGDVVIKVTFRSNHRGCLVSVPFAKKVSPRFSFNPADFGEGSFPDYPSEGLTYNQPPKGEYVIPKVGRGRYQIVVPGTMQYTALYDPPGIGFGPESVYRKRTVTMSEALNVAIAYLHPSPTERGATLPGWRSSNRPTWCIPSGGGKFPTKWF